MFGLSPNCICQSRVSEGTKWLEMTPSKTKELLQAIQEDHQCGFNWPSPNMPGPWLVGVHQFTKGAMHGGDTLCGVI